ncbi:cytochrome P450 [Xylaria cf. heliscus]|nr:cytochrome P450 [Xylaria cf. heliscus]
MILNVPSLFISLSIGLLVTYVVHGFVYLVNKKSQPPLPPGPRGLPLVGNLNDLPKPGVLEAHHWLKHKKLYGPISSVTVLGKSIVIINDARLALELFEKRSAKYSSRPKQVFASELLGWENTIGLSPYNKRFRAMRKNLSRLIGSNKAVAELHEVQRAETSHFLLHVLRSPDNIQEHIRKTVGAMVLKIAYGYTAESHQPDVLIDMVGDSMEKFGRAAVPGAFMVDVFPLLKKLPDWAPGAGFKKLAREWAAELLDVTEKPYAFVKYQMAQGRDETSFMSRLIEIGDSGLEENDINKWSAASLYTAGADTTVSAIRCFFLAMIIYPEVEKRAQEEIDRIIGNTRLPTMADRESLPYIDAVVKETLRWHPVAPMGLPHENTEDDVYNGYLIPEGSMLFANIWHFTHDPDVYHDPNVFKPERFLARDGHKPEPDPKKFVFGFGRRICPGRILADNSLFLIVAQSLAVFSTKRYDGIDVQPDFIYESMFQPGVVSHPIPYKSTPRPRSHHHEKIIRSLEETYPWQQSDAKILEKMSS